MSTLFISDLHLEPSREDITAQFLEFMAGPAREAETLYLLGDVFEAWVGDDFRNSYSDRIEAAIREVSDAGVACRFMHGNRDFLVGDAFAERTGCTLLDEETVVDLYGEQVLLMHGDSLCTDDIAYQQFRKMVRDPNWQRQFLGLPAEQRVALARQARERSRTDSATKTDDIMDVNPRTVEATMRAHGVHTLLHGHTHRPAVHEFELDGTPARRIVLGDWYTQGSMVRWNADGFELQTLDRST